MNVSTGAVSRPVPRHTPRPAGPFHRTPVWAAAAIHPGQTPPFPAGDTLFVVDARDLGRAWVPGGVRTVRVGRDVTGSALGWSSYLDELAAAGRRPRALVFDLPAGTTGPERAMELVLPALRAASSSTCPDPLHIAFLITGRARPGLAAAFGAVAQAAAVEDGRLHAVSICVETVPAWADDPMAVALAELALPRTRLAEVRYTAKGREVRALSATRRPPPAAARAGLRTGGRYLVTDSGSGEGVRLATALAREHAARIVLFGPLRRPVAAGARIVRVTGQLPRYDDARTAVYAALHTFGGLDGVVHCADPGKSRLLARQSAVVARQTVADAVSGAAHLDRATAALPLDFFALVTDAAAYEPAAGCSVSAAVGRAFGAIAAARGRLALTDARQGASVSICTPAHTDQLTALAEAIGSGHSEVLAEGPRAA